MTRFWLAALVLLSSAPAIAGELRVGLDGLRSPEGTVLIGLYDTAESFDAAIGLADKEGFLNDPQRVAGAALRANPELVAAIVFSNLAPGRYAAIVFHDENGNGRLDKNFWGVPTEPYGFSNDARGTLGPPSFADSAIELGDEDRAIVVTMVYHRGAAAVAASPTKPKSRLVRRSEAAVR